MAPNEDEIKKETLATVKEKTQPSKGLPLVPNFFQKEADLASLAPPWSQFYAPRGTKPTLWRNCGPITHML